MRFSANIFAKRACYEVMFGEMASKWAILPSFVGDDASFRRDVFLNNRKKVLRTGSANMGRTSIAPTLYER